MHVSRAAHSAAAALRSIAVAAARLSDFKRPDKSGYLTVVSLLGRSSVCGEDLSHDPANGVVVIHDEDTIGHGLLPGGGRARLRLRCWKRGTWTSHEQVRACDSSLESQYFGTSRSGQSFPTIRRLKTESSFALNGLADMLLDA
jgi:hypothetical protein